MVTKKPLTKTQLIAAVANDSGITKKEVAALFESLTTVIQRQIGRNSAGVITAIPGLIKIVKKQKPAVKGGVEKINPFTGEPMVTKAKPVRNVVKVTALKKLKDMVQ